MPTLRESFETKLSAFKSQWERQKWVMGPVILLVGGAWVFGAYSEAQAWRARNIVRKFLDAPDSEFSVSVNYRAWLSDNGKVQAVREIHFQEGRHTHTVHNIAVVFRMAQADLELTLERYSARILGFLD